MKKVGLLICAALMMVTQMALADVYYDVQPPEDWADKTLLEWTLFDVNEGDAMLLSCGGESMMVDGGPAPFRDQLADALDARGLRTMKYFLNTHYHDDHIDGLYYLLKKGFAPEAYLHSYSPSAIESSELCKRTWNEAQKHDVPVERIGNGDTLTLGDAKIDVYQYEKILNTNARSLVLRVQFGESSVLLCADIIGDTQRYFTKNLPAEVLDCDIVKLPHHAITPAVPEFLDAISPLAAMVTNTPSRVKNSSKSQLESRDLVSYYAGSGTVYAVTDGMDWYIWQTPGEF